MSKSDGTLYQAKKCQKKDRKLSWNIRGRRGPAGPAGKNGTDGKNGTNGANGAVAGFSATTTTALDITKKTTFTDVVTKTLPAGSYIVTGSANLLATDSSGQAANSACRLIAGTAESPIATWSSPLGAIFLFKLADGSVTMQMPLTLSAASTVSLQCRNNLNSPPATFEAFVSNATLTAIQTSSNS